MTKASDARRLLMSGLVDFAGLFPPAALSMAESTRRYAEYRSGVQSWALGKFVVPAARLNEFEIASKVFIAEGDPWPLSVLAASNLSDAEHIETFARRTEGRIAIDAIELKAGTAREVTAIARKIKELRGGMPSTLDAYIEVPIAEDPSSMIKAIGASGLRAKVRTGGIEAANFPTAAQLARFLAACAAYDVIFKATAGLHHAVRGMYPFTYERNSERGMMFGFMNVFLAALFVRDGLGTVETIALLEERDAHAFKFSAAGITWRGRTVTAPSVRASRAKAAASFGSCSFSEPVADLIALGLT